MSMAPAGALEYVNPGWASQLKTADIDQKAVINLTNAAVSATVKTAIQGSSYEQNLQASLLAAGIDTAAGWAANQIGNGVKNCEGPLSELQGQYLAHKVAHALLGCAGASAKGQDCASGAIGGAVGETFAEFYAGTNDGSTLTPEKQNEVLQVSKLVAAAVAGIAGKDANAAVDAAQNAVLNNWTFRELAFAAKHPQIAADIGEVQDGVIIFLLLPSAFLLKGHRKIHHPQSLQLSQGGWETRSELSVMRSGKRLLPINMVLRLR